MSGHDFPEPNYHPPQRPEPLWRRCAQFALAAVAVPAGLLFWMLERHARAEVPCSPPSRREHRAATRSESIARAIARGLAIYEEPARWGRTAFANKVPRRSNPYRRGTDSYRLWRAGWDSARAEERAAASLKRRMGDYAAWPPERR